MRCMDEVVSFCLSLAFEQLRNLRPPQDGVTALSIALNNLRGRRDDVHNRICQAEAVGEICLPEVRAWLENVRICENKANEIKDECCLRCFLLNCWSINARLSQLLCHIERLTAQLFKAVAFRALPGALQEIAIQSKPFGLESYVEKVDCYLADDEVHMVGIWGVGGVGKTTLLRTINNELLPGGRLSQRNSFDHVLFVEASRDYRPKKLQKSIIRQLGLDLKDVHDVEVRAAVIEEFLRRRNFLLLLDDLWDFVDLEKMGILLDNPKHKVIFTTGSEKVCCNMPIEKRIKMERLDPRNARLLFEHNIGQEAVSMPTLRNLMEDVIQRCDGLPLALTTIARAMALKTDRDEWERANALLQQSRLDKILDEDDGQSFERLYEVLKISYDRLLDDTAKECFLSCALWPAGCSIQKLELIQSWMGLGLLDESINCNFDKAYSKGNRVIENLKTACLLEPDLINENKVKMHAVIRGTALWIANEKGAAMNKWIVKEDTGLATVLDNLESWSAAQRISLMHHRLTELPLTLDCPRLSSLMLQKNPILTKIPRDFFRFMVALSFLDLSFTGLCELPEEIGSLLQLHYLNLSNTPISSLPNSLKNLKRLQYLLLNNTRYLKKMQHGLISSLSMLLVLDLFGCGYADWEVNDQCKRASFREFNRLKQGLKFLGITIETSEALFQLSETPGVSTQHLGIVGWVDETSLQQLMDLLCRPRIYQNLKQLKVENCGSSKVLTIGDEKGSRRLPRLQVLELRNLIRLTQIVWTAVKPREYLPMIRELKISDCDTLEDVSWVLDLQHLERLELSNCKSMKKVVKNDFGKEIVCDDHGIEVGDEEVMKGPFCGLRMLILKELSALRRVCDHAYDFPALEYLEVQDCQMLQQLPFSSKIIKNKSLVIHGENEWWNNLVWKDEVGNIKDYLRFYKFEGR